MDANSQAAVDAVKTVAETAAPVILAAALASNPNAKAIAELAPVALQLLQTANTLHNAGAMSQQQLADLFSSVGAGLKASHDAWVAMDAPKAA